MILDPEIENIIKQVIEDCKKRKHEYVLVEHLLLALLENKECIEILTKCQASISGLKTEIDGWSWVEKDSRVKIKTDLVVKIERWKIDRTR